MRFIAARFAGNESYAAHRLLCGPQTATKIFIAECSRVSSRNGGTRRRCELLALICAFFTAVEPRTRSAAVFSAKIFPRRQSADAAFIAHARTHARASSCVRNDRYDLLGDNAESRISSAFLHGVDFQMRIRADAQLLARVLVRATMALMRLARRARHLHTKLSGVTVIFFLL